MKKEIIIETPYWKPLLALIGATIYNGFRTKNVNYLSPYKFGKLAVSSSPLIYKKRMVFQVPEPLAHNPFDGVVTNILEELRIKGGNFPFCMIRPTRKSYLYYFMSTLEPRISRVGARIPLRIGWGTRYTGVIHVGVPQKTSWYIEMIFHVLYDKPTLDLMKSKKGARNE